MVDFEQIELHHTPIRGRPVPIEVVFVDVNVLAVGHREVGVVFLHRGPLDGAGLASGDQREVFNMPGVVSP